MAERPKAWDWRPWPDIPSPKGGPGSNPGPGANLFNPVGGGLDGFGAVKKYNNALMWF